jgi:hypothetical protein
MSRFSYFQNSPFFTCFCVFPHQNLFYFFYLFIFCKQNLISYNSKKTKNLIRLEKIIGQYIKVFKIKKKTNPAAFSSEKPVIAHTSSSSRSSHFAVSFSFFFICFFVLILLFLFFSLLPFLYFLPFAF